MSTLYPVVGIIQCIYIYRPRYRPPRGGSRVTDYIKNKWSMAWLRCLAVLLPLPLSPSHT